MKKNTKLVILSTILLLSSCTFSYSSSSEFLSESSNVTSSEQSYENSSESSFEISSESSSEHSSEISSESSNEVSSESSLPDVELKNLFIDESNYSIYGSYSTNFETTYVSGYTFGTYRANNPSGDAFISLTPYSTYVDDGTQEGSIYNISPIYGMRYITLTYKTNFQDGDAPILSYGEDFIKNEFIELELSKQEITKTYCLYDSNFFKINTNNNRINITSISIDYTDIEEQYHTNLQGSGNRDFRLNPIHYEGELIPGVTKVEVPMKVEYTTDGYNVLETKEYTYYTYDYIVSNPSLANEASLIDPTDIAAYYNTFKTHPVNYVVKKQYNNAKTYFGNNTRCISTYSRTNGYATSVPWQRQPSNNTPLYHELDIDVEGNYSNNNRGVGRLVVWYYGFTSNGYDSSPVSVFTSDHYCSFQEYMNDGTFGNKFNAEMKVTNYTFSPAVTKN